MAKRGEHALPAAMFGFFAVQRDQLVFGRRTAQLLLNGQQDGLQLGPINLLKQRPKGRLTWGRVATVAFANAQGRSLRLGKFRRHSSIAKRFSGRVRLSALPRVASR